MSFFTEKLLSCCGDLAIGKVLDLISVSKPRRLFDSLSKAAVRHERKVLFGVPTSLELLQIEDGNTNNTLLQFKSILKEINRTLIQFPTV